MGSQIINAKHSYDPDAHRHDFIINRNIGNQKLFHFISRIEHNYTQGEPVSVIINGLNNGTTQSIYNNCNFITTQGINATTDVFITGTVCDFYVKTDESPTLLCMIHALVA